MFKIYERITRIACIWSILTTMAQVRPRRAAFGPI